MADTLDPLICSISAYQIALLAMLSSDANPNPSATEADPFFIFATDYAKKSNELHALYNQLSAEGYVPYIRSVPFQALILCSRCF